MANPKVVFPIGTDTDITVSLTDSEGEAFTLPKASVSLLTAHMPGATGGCIDYTLSASGTEITSEDRGEFKIHVKRADALAVSENVAWQIDLIKDGKKSKILFSDGLTIEDDAIKC